MRSTKQRQNSVVKWGREEQPLGGCSEVSLKQVFKVTRGWGRKRGWEGVPNTNNNMNEGTGTGPEH